MVCDLKTDGRKGRSGRPRLPDDQLTPDALRMRKSRELRARGIFGRSSMSEEERLRRQRAAQKRMRERNRALDANNIPTVENRTCGFPEPPLEQYAHEICKGTAFFWTKRGKVEPPASRLPQWDASQRQWLFDALVCGRDMTENGRAKAKRYEAWA